MKLNFKTLFLAFIALTLLLVMSIVIYVVVNRSKVATIASAEIITPEGGKVAGTSISTCPNMDVNGDYILDLVDFAEFSKYYRQECSTAHGQVQNMCPSLDSNGDEVIDLVDLAYFSSRYRDVCFL